MVADNDTLPPKRWRKRRAYPAPDWSACVYVQLNPSTVHMFRFFLEAYDNLGMMSVVDRWRAVLKIRFSPHQAQEMHEALQQMQQSMEFEVVEVK